MIGASFGGLCFYLGEYREVKRMLWKGIFLVMLLGCYKGETGVIIDKRYEEEDTWYFAYPPTEIVEDEYWVIILRYWHEKRGKYKHTHFYVTEEIYNQVKIGGTFGGK